MKKLNKLLLYTFLGAFLLLSCNNEQEESTSKKRDTMSSKADSLNKESPKSGKTQENEVLCKCFLLDVQVYLFDTIQGNIIDSIKNDTVAEAYYIVEILQQQDQWVKINTRVLNTKKSGWIKFQKDYFGVYGANYVNELKFFDKPDTTSNIVHTFPRDNPREPLKILDWRDNWRKVKVNNIIGWVKEKRVCPTPYTTCS